MLLITALFLLFPGSFKNHNDVDLSGQVENHIVNQKRLQYNVTFYYYAVCKITYFILVRL